MKEWKVNLTLFTSTGEFRQYTETRIATSLQQAMDFSTKLAKDRGDVLIAISGEDHY